MNIFTDIDIETLDRDEARDIIHLALFPPIQANEAGETVMNGEILKTGSEFHIQQQDDQYALRIDDGKEYLGNDPDILVDMANSDNDDTLRAFAWSESIQELGWKNSEEMDESDYQDAINGWYPSDPKTAERLEKILAIAYES